MNNKTFVRAGIQRNAIFFVFTQTPLFTILRQLSVGKSTAEGAVAVQWNIPWRESEAYFQRRLRLRHLADISFADVFREYWKGWRAIISQRFFVGDVPSGITPLLSLAEAGPVTRPHDTSSPFPALCRRPRRHLSKFAHQSRCNAHECATLCRKHTNEIFRRHYILYSPSITLTISICIVKFNIHIQGAYCFIIIHEHLTSYT